MSYTKNKKEDFIKKINDKYPLEELEVLLYTGAKGKGIIQCKKCGSIYELKNASNFLYKSKKKICKKCFPREDTAAIGHKIDYVLSNTDKITLLNEYTKITDDLMLLCNHCKQVFKRKPQLFLKSQTCPYCESFSTFKTKDVFELQLQEKYGNEYILIGEYKGTNTSTLFKHNDCGFIFANKPHNILTKAPCPKCKKFNSKGEIKIEKILKQHNISFQKQKRFIDFSSLLSFDFYIKDKNLLIEFQGEQHYQPIKHFGGKDKFLKQQENDKRKREYCRKNNYSLLEISYMEIDNIEQILSFLWLND